jgi:hypothetical protein
MTGNRGRKRTTDDTDRHGYGGNVATLYPFSGVTEERLRMGPEPGETHRWLAQVASGLSGVMPAERCFAFLRRCCDECVAHRAIPDRELEAAVELAYSETGTTTNFGRRALKWPKQDDGVIRQVLAEVAPIFEGYAGTGLRPEAVLRELFRPGELVCTGAVSERATVRPVEEVIHDAELLQFIVVNPMRGRAARNHQGKESVRCQNNVGARRHVVAEFDDERLDKRMQAQLATALGEMAPLVMAVDSGGKSVHAWYRVEEMSARDQARFFAVACLLGADPTRWDVCGWLRMPAGLRLVGGVPKVRQRILYWHGERATDPSFAKGYGGQVGN